MAIEFVQTLCQAFEESKKAMENGQKELVLDLIQESQQNAIEFGNVIEKCEGEEFVTVRFLEEYCECLYQLYISLLGEESVPSLERTWNELGKALAAVQNSVDQDIPERLEAVFLPYKAAMWDSMETIWRAADADPDCDAYVIPIPYFDRNPDGSIREWHYEKENYPADIPMLRYTEYNMERQKPDVVFVHFPYDRNNYVTGILPDHYCKTLRSQTDLLVYVPYFVNLDDVPWHFCVCPGTLYADMVAVQSERVRETYVRESKKFEQENQCQGQFGDLEKKFLALGSPKIDKAMQLASEHFSVPEEWKKHLLMKDGSRKKIVLVNTTLKYLLERKEDYIEHLWEIFSVFQRYGAIALWWRPHPLAESSLAAMDEALCQKYLMLVSSFKKNNLGIYDDSGELHRAIGMCDACYGDNSSVLALLMAAKKPVMLRNMTRSFPAGDTGTGKFMNAVKAEKGGMKKMILFENREYALEHFLYDLLHEGQWEKIIDFMESVFSEYAHETCSNLGRAGESIYQEAKKRCQEEN